MTASRILIVPKGDYQGAVKGLGALARKNAVHILYYDIVARSIGPQSEIGYAYAASGAYVGLSPKLMVAVCDSYQIEEQELKGFRGNWQEAITDVIHWIQPFDVISPAPTFKEIAEAVKRECDNRICYTEKALFQADRVSVEPSDDAGTFPEFFKQSLYALDLLAKKTLGHAGHLGEFIAQNAEMAKYASSGNESVEFDLPTDPPQRCSTRLHLKPTKERSGYHAREIKPRLYFKMISHDGKTIAVVCYFGPHPESGKAIYTGKLIVN